ncbi:hypothetical protein DEO72_LG2g4520 [Vigna unguiculata]|uniref:Uncharacterized protein n=1 Tax=Vigna unguiculata TaxID=3917 RepID=A0A4D6L6R8_VIGUN|nr:hypothetical protein DEO72_LG2g4520 [Vigna unguiculata]
MHMPPGGTLILSPFLDFWYELPGGESGIARRCITIITVSLCCCEFCEIMNSPLFSDVLRLHIVIGAVSGPDVSPGGVMVAARRQFMDGVTCDDMSGEVRRAGLRAGRFVEAGPRAGSSPFLFVCGDDRVIRYTGADVDTGGAEDAQMAE